jgi:hypothetical protein
MTELYDDVNQISIKLFFFLKESKAVFQDDDGGLVYSDYGGIGEKWVNLKVEPTEFAARSKQNVYEISFHKGV